MATEVMTVHVVDDDEAVRRSLAVLLQSYGYVVQIYGSGLDFLERIEGRRAPASDMAMACVVLDLCMPGMDGVAVQQAMRERGIRLPVVAVSGEADVGLAVRVMKAGATDLIEKPYAEDALLRAITSAMAIMVDSEPPAASREAARAKLTTLTVRERDVLASIVQGHPNKIIAHALGISPRTVEIHRSNLMLKLECRGIAEVVRLGLHAGFC